MCGGKYASYGEYRQAADVVLRKELDLGHLEWAESQQELEAVHGPITCSRSAGVAKQRSGELQVRLVHVLRRSGVTRSEVSREGSPT